MGGLEFHGDLEASEAANLFVQSALGLRPDSKLASDDHPARRYLPVGGRHAARHPAGGQLDTDSVPGRDRRRDRAQPDFLETRMRDIPERQRSIRAVLNPLWDGLTDEVREVFQRTSIFWGGFTRAAFEAVTGGSLRSLSLLVDKSLVRHDDDGRYRMHELLAQYAWEQLKKSPEDVQATRRRHARFFARFLEDQLADLMGDRPRSAQAAINVEVENVRAAWRTMAELHMAQEIRQSASSMWFYFLDSYLVVEGMELFEQALALLEEAGGDDADARFCRGGAGASGDRSSRSTAHARKARRPSTRAWPS
ncbi:MAG: hypothetical protein IPK19_29075 [Chloroflexi bacterium]|nr:hypothetical protein [Chloroflexota bacterium]